MFKSIKFDEALTFRMGLEHSSCPYTVSDNTWPPLHSCLGTASQGLKMKVRGHLVEEDWSGKHCEAISFLKNIQS